jgi:DNA (cytosine-5)-methyltransferase 1
MSLGFEQAGFTVAAAVDLSEINARIHEKNFPNTATICGDVRELDGASIRRIAKLEDVNIDVVFGGPPCQGFSIGGKQLITDPRNELLLEFARLVTELQPNYFVMENVAGLLGERYAPLLKKFTRVLREGGYSFVEPLIYLDAADFGVPQRRKRVFVLGCREGEAIPSYPMARRDRVSVGAAIDDLKITNRSKLVDGDSYSGPLGAPTPYSLALRKPRGRSRLTTITGFARTAHSAEVVERFRRVKQGGVDPISRFIRLDRDSVAPTLRAGTGAENGRFMAPRPIHPDYPRCITVREAARLHSFPDWFVFHDTKWNGFMQVGNSVPPVLAKAVADEIKRSLKRKPNAPPAVPRNDFTPNGDRQIAQHGTGAVGTFNRSRVRDAVSSEESRSTGLARPSQ